MLATLKMAYAMSFTYPCPRKLREIMKMSMIEKEPAGKVENIWKEYHKNRSNNICTVLTKDKYSHFANKASSSPYFIIPVFRKSGHFKLLTQWQKNCFLGTFLQDFKRKGSNAYPYVVFTLFTQLLFNKGIVLVRGDIVNNALSKAEAEQVWSQLESSYTHEDVFQLVHNFNNNPSQFHQNKYNQMFHIHV